MTRWLGDPTYPGLIDGADCTHSPGAVIFRAYDDPVVATAALGSWRDLSNHGWKAIKGESWFVLVDIDHFNDFSPVGGREVMEWRVIDSEVPDGSPQDERTKCHRFVTILVEKLLASEPLTNDETQGFEEVHSGILKLAQSVASKVDVAAYTAARETGDEYAAERVIGDEMRNTRDFCMKGGRG